MIGILYSTITPLINWPSRDALYTTMPQRVIGTVRNKYTLLSAKVPINVVLPCQGEDTTFLDKIVSVCCSLTNMSKSVVQS